MGFFVFPWNSSNSTIDLSTDSLDFEVEWVWTPVVFIPKEVDKSSPSSVVSDLKSHYEGETELQVVDEINKVSNVDEFDLDAVEEIYSEATWVIDSNNIVTDWATSESVCTWSLVEVNPTISNNTWLTIDTPYQNIDDTADCYFACKTWYFWDTCEFFKIVASDIEDHDSFWSSTFVSSNLTTVLVWAPSDDDGANMSWSAYIFELGSSWEILNETKLTAFDWEEKDSFWTWAFISGDWSIAVIWTPKNDDNWTNTWSVYIFEKTWSNWVQSDLLSIDFFWSSVEITFRAEVIKTDLK